MNIFSFEHEFLDTIEEHDRLVRDCAAGRVTFKNFIKAYDDFYWRFALDGHESDEDELTLFEKYADRIKPHKELAVEILSRVCADEDAAKDSFIKAGRFGSDEAVKRIGNLSRTYFDQ